MAVRCSQLGVKISSLLDRELNELEARWLRSHIEGCARCAREYRELRSARLSARALGHHEPPEDFWRGMASRMDSLESGAVPDQVPYVPAVHPRRLSFIPADAFGHVLAMVIAVSILSGLVLLASHDRLLFHLREPQPVAFHLRTGTGSSRAGFTHRTMSIRRLPGTGKIMQPEAGRHLPPAAAMNPRVVTHDARSAR